MDSSFTLSASLVCCYEASLTGYGPTGTCDPWESGATRSPPSPVFDWQGDRAKTDKRDAVKQRRPGVQLLGGKPCMIRRVASAIETRIEQATHGDPVAVDELLEQLLPGLRAFVRLRAGHVLLGLESSADLVQSTCRDVLENLGRFEHGGADGFRRWLYCTATRKIADRYQHYRSEKRDIGREQAVEGPLLTSTDPTASQHAVAVEQQARIEAALRCLPPDYAEVIALARFAGLSHREIAAEMGRTEVAVRSLLSRALADLAGQLDDD